MVAVTSDYSKAVAFTVSNTSFQGLETQVLVQPDARASNQFGSAMSMAADGLTLAVAAAGDEGRGAVLIYNRQFGQWSLSTKLYVIEAGEGASVGATVALNQDGTTLFIGVPGYKDGNGVATGAVVPFQLSKNGWVKLDPVFPNVVNNNARFGASLTCVPDGSKFLAAGLVGDVQLVKLDNGQYVFDKAIRAMGTLTKAPALAMAADLSKIVIGVGTAAGGAGEVYTLFLQPDLTYLEATLVASDAAPGARFGESLSLSSDGAALVVAAPGTGNNRGSIYVTTRSGNKYIQQSSLLAPDAAAGDYFGESLKLSSDGQRLAVGAQRKKVNEVANKGQAYFFRRIGNIFMIDKTLTASRASASLFGAVVAMPANANYVAVACPGQDISAGAVYSFD